ncbi:hypothetical protein L1987_19948 [Smallanthus sonchifolius]|uniref:Uncharacterized protein n=1 Tax=Smallanthus sonchifolius TaxID=185202 RepID=A0ACB9IR91_9ASTR|nr:hypothetical protein L1987_19948 [Smallanthus sonchifolius]
MGFGKLLTFKVDGIPSKLAHYDVDKFNASKMKIRTHSGDSGDIKVDTYSIHSVLGVPKGGIKVYSTTPLEVLDDKCRKMKVDYTLNQTTLWTMDRLRIRERLEIKGSGFGKGRFKGLMVSVNNKSGGEMEDVSLEFQEEYTVLKKLDDFEEKKKEIEIELSEDNSVEKTNSKIGDVLKKINEDIVEKEIHGVNENEMEDNNIDKLDIEVDLESDDNIDLNQVFQSETTEKDEEAREMDIDQGKEMQSNDDQNKNMFVEVGKVKKVIVDVELKKGTNDGGKMDEKSKECNNIEDNDGPSYSLGITQDGLILTGEEQQNTDEEGVKTVEDNGRPSYSLGAIGISQEKVIPMLEATRKIPFIDKGVADVNNMDIVFRSVNNLELTLSIIRSLKPGEKVYNNIIDAWVERSSGSPYRLFVGTNVIVDWMLNKIDSSRDERYERFHRNMYGGICGNKLMNEMKHFDIILFPILEHGHYYLLNFELKNGAITVIDNFHESIALVGINDSQDYFKKDFTYKIYLERHGQPKAYEIKTAKIKKIDIPWVTKKNEVDCGIFVITHMEKYMGIKEQFFCGLNSNVMKKKGQLNALRKKFAAHILQSKVNLLKEKIHSAAQGSKGGKNVTFWICNIQFDVLEAL